jgi:hypothetical protein
MSRRTRARLTSPRLASFGLLAALAALVLGAAVGAGPAVAKPAAAAAAGTFKRTEKISRVNLVNGQMQVADTRTVTATVSPTTGLRDGQEINVSWSGAHPTGDIAQDPTSELGSEEEYPVVLMMCRGSATATGGKNLITPQTCWTQTPAERVQPAVPNNSQVGNFPFPPYRLDLYAAATDRTASVGVPAKPPAACSSSTTGTQYWVPFVALGGHQYNIGQNGCAGLPPEAQNVVNALAPGNTTYGVTNLGGDGSAAFRITTAETNQSLGCSSTVPCALAVIPIMGISCDPDAHSLAPSERPPSDLAAQAFALCSEGADAGTLGQMGPAGESGQEALAVSGQLWWSASNWRNRILVPLKFAPTLPACSLASTSSPVQIYGSYLMLEATQQWTPHFCLNSKLHAIEQVVLGEPEAQTQLQQAVLTKQLGAGQTDAVFQGAPAQTPFPSHVVQAPTALTGFAIVFDIVNQFGKPFTTVRLDARLLAKLLTESYPADTGVQHDDTALQNPSTHQPNPLNMAEDPEFQALNPGVPSAVIGKIAGVSPATILAMSGDSDLMWALTSYINADPEARAWLNGKPDPWGMVVNPKYKGIKLPVTQWPLLDTYLAPSVQLSNPCLQQSPSPYLGLVASPVQAIAQITLDLEFNVSDSQVGCNAAGAFSSTQAVGREFPGETFIFGITSLADARRFDLQTASLQTHGGSASDAKFTSAAGRTFVAPTDSALRAALKIMVPDKTAGTWTVPYASMRTSAAGRAAYPGVMLVSTDLPTHGLPKSLANEYGQFLSFVAGSGQRAGLGVGQLPPGYLPLTAASAAKMVAYTRAAAADVAAQNAKVPNLNGSHPGGSRSHSPSPSPTPTSSSGSTSGISQPTSGTTSGTPAPSSGIQTKTATPATTSPQPIDTTALTKSTLSGAIIPLILLIALIGATIAYGAWQLTRPTEPQ